MSMQVICGSHLNGDSDCQHWLVLHLGFWSLCQVVLGHILMLILVLGHCHVLQALLPIIFLISFLLSHPLGSVCSSSLLPFACLRIIQFSSFPSTHMKFVWCSKGVGQHGFSSSVFAVFCQMLMQCPSLKKLIFSTTSCFCKGKQNSFTIFLLMLDSRAYCGTPK